MSHQRNYPCIEVAGIRENNFHEALIPFCSIGAKTSHSEAATAINRPRKCPPRARENISYVKTYGKTHQNSLTNFSTIGEISALRRLVSTITLSLLPGKRSTLVENPQVLP